jgi:hypothetical protein
MQIRSYPDKSYTCDGELQKTVSQYAAFRDRFSWQCLVVVFGCIVGIVIGGSLVVTTLVWFFTAFIGIIFIILIFFDFYNPRPACPRCTCRMKSQYVRKIRGSGRDLFFICDPCKIYADAHVSRD